MPQSSSTGVEFYGRKAQPYIITVVNNSDSNLTLRASHTPDNYSSIANIPKHGGSRTIQISPNDVYRQYCVGVDVDDSEIFITFDDCIKYKEIIIDKGILPNGRRPYRMVERSHDEAQQIHFQNLEAKLQFLGDFPVGALARAHQAPPSSSPEAIVALLPGPAAPATSLFWRNFFENGVKKLLEDPFISVCIIGLCIFISYSSTSASNYTIENSTLILVSLKESMSNLMGMPALFFLAEILLVWYFFSHIEERRAMWKYSFWRYFTIIFGDHLSSRFADWVREEIQGLAPCNFFQGVVRPSKPTSTYVARHIQGEVPDTQVEVLDIPHPTRSFDAFSDTCKELVFTIGEGHVIVDRVDEQQFLFKCVARGRTMEEFGATLDSKCVHKVISILEYWETSPDVGVIENLFHRKEGILCHCLNLQAIVEGVFTTTGIGFALFKLKEPCVFLVGSKEEAASSSRYDKIWLPLFLSILVIVSTYYQLKDSYLKVAIIHTCLLAVFASVALFSGIVDVIILKVLTHKIFHMFGSKRRLNIYRWGKKSNWCLAFTDYFNPVLRLPGDTELILIKPCTYGYIRARQSFVLNWSRLGINRDTHPRFGNGIELVTIDSEAELGSGWGNEVIERFVRFQDLDPSYPPSGGYVRLFTLEFPGARKVHAETKYKDPRISRLAAYLPISLEHLGNHVLTTQLRIDEEDCQEYVWTERKYYLFLYIMIMWKKTGNGAVKSFLKPYLNRRFIEVRGVHELAGSIQRLDEASFNVLPGAIRNSQRWYDRMA